MTGSVNDINRPIYMNIASITTRTNVLGPGTRGLVWVKGCPFSCPGCIAPNWISPEGGNRMTPEDILRSWDISLLEGLTFSGGEPMEQANGLAALARMAKSKKNLNIICFTGYRYDRLLNNPPNEAVGDLLNEIDVLIDGPYIQAQNDSVGLRGSKNQRIIHLTPALKQHDFDQQKRKVEVTVSDGQFNFVGIPTPAIQAALNRARLTETQRIAGNERI